MVSAVLISWKRQNNFAKIIPYLLKYSFIDEIIIIDNAKGKNLGTYGRYVGAKRARNDIIYIQDDDCLIHGLESIYETYMKDTSKLTYGTQAHLEPEYHGDNHMAILGWGTFFNRKWVDFDPYTDKYGKDYCFYREADRIFTMLLDGKHTPVVVEVEHLDGASGEEAMWKQDDHIKYKNLSIERCLELQ